MALESVTYISDFDADNPFATDPFYQGAAHIRNLKRALKLTFPAVTGAVTSSHTELNISDGLTATAAELNKLDNATVTAAEFNFLGGVTSAIQTQIDAKLNGLTRQNISSGSTAASVGYMYINTANGGITLPASASSGNTIVYVNTSEGTRSIITNGHNINGQTVSSFSVAGLVSVTLIYVDTTTGWAKHDA